MTDTFTDLVLHPVSRQALTAFLKAPKHAVLLSGGEAMGKRLVASRLAGSLLGVKPEKLDIYPYVVIIAPQNKVISIESIRNLQTSLKLKTTGNSRLRRALIIEEAHTMTHEAQNAFLKTLEEPASDTVIILTASHSQNLLPTIRSRTQVIDIKRPRVEELVAHFAAQGHGPAAVERAYRLSGGRLGVMHSLLAKTDEKHPVLAAIEQAKQFLTAESFEQLKQIDTWSKQKDELPDKLLALEQVCRAALRVATKKAKKTLTDRWLQKLSAIHSAREQLKHNPNLKLLLTNLVLHL